MKKSLFAAAPVIALLLMLTFGSSKAAGNAEILQVHISGQNMTVVTNAALNPDTLTCLISNQDAEITGAGVLTDDGTLIKTTILVDVSTSMPRNIRDNLIAVLQLMVDRKPANEEFRLTTFGEEVKILQDFTVDRYDLSNAISKIKFEDKETRIYEAIYDTIPEKDPEAASTTFYRTIVVTDGVDYTNSGITKEEFFIILQNERYPIDVVAVGAVGASEDRELSAIVRISGGRYHYLAPDTDAAALNQDLGVSDYSYITAIIPGSLLDGTTRQIDIGDGANMMSVDFKIPIFNVPAAPPPVTESASQSPDIESTTPKPSPSDTSAKEASKTPETPSPSAAAEAGVLETVLTLFGDNTILIYIVTGAVLILVIAAIIVIVVVRGKKKKNAGRPRMGYKLGSESGIGITEFFGEGSTSGSSFTIKISKSNDPSVSWTLPVENEIKIGRAENCTVRLEDKSVSREHCKIVAQGAGLVLIHLSTSNKTYLNGNNVDVNTPLQSGDKLKIGYETLQIDYIQTLGSPVQNNRQQQGSVSSETEAIF